MSGQGGAADALIVPFPRSGEPVKGLRELRTERGWSQAGAARAMVACATDQEKKGLPGLDALVRSWKRWEAGEVEPDGTREPFYKPIIARMFGTTPEDIWPQRRPQIKADNPARFREAAQLRRSHLVQVIGTLQAELDYLDAVLSVPMPVA